MHVFSQTLNLSVDKNKIEDQQKTKHQKNLILTVKRSQKYKLKKLPQNRSEAFIQKLQEFYVY